MLSRPSVNTAPSRDFTLQSAGFCDATPGEDTDTTRFRNFSKSATQAPTTRKTTAKTTKSTTPEIEKTPIFASVKNLIRLFLTGLIFSECVCAIPGTGQKEK